MTKVSKIVFFSLLLCVGISVYAQQEQTNENQTPEAVQSTDVTPTAAQTGQKTTPEDSLSQEQSTPDVVQGQDQPDQATAIENQSEVSSPENDLSQEQPVANVVSSPEQSPNVAPTPNQMDQDETPESMPSDQEATSESIPVPAPEVLKQSLLDTIDIEEGGNWLKKRQILEEAFKMVGRINDLAIEINNSRMSFLKIRNDADKKFNAFLASSGFSLGDLSNAITSITISMDKERVEDGALDEGEREVLQAAEQNKIELDNVQKGIKVIDDRDNRINDIMLRAEQQIMRSEGYRKKAWLNLESIKKVLNDEKAERLLADIKALYETMNDIYINYLQGSLLNDLKETVNVMGTQINTINTKLATLKQQGVDLTSKAETLKEQEDKQERQDLAKEAAEKQAAKDKQNKRGWFDWFFDLFRSSSTKDLSNDSDESLVDQNTADSEQSN